MWLRQKVRPQNEHDAKLSPSNSGRLQTPQRTTSLLASKPTNLMVDLGHKQV
jgi:hypothetical protein